MALQPNFEKIKIAVVETAKKNEDLDMQVLLNTVRTGKAGKHHAVKRKELIDQMYNRLDTMGIQNVGILIEYAKAKLPSWIVKKQFVIDYNKNEMLDLIRISN